MQIKITMMKFNFTSVMLAKIKNSDNTKGFFKDIYIEELRILVDCCWEYKLVQPLW